MARRIRKAGPAGKKIIVFAETPGPGPASEFSSRVALVAMFAGYVSRERRATFPASKSCAEPRPERLPPVIMRARLRDSELRRGRSVVPRYVRIVAGEFCRSRCRELCRGRSDLPRLRVRLYKPLRSGP